MSLVSPFRFANLLALCVLLPTLLFCVQAQGTSTDLSTLTTKFQSLITELGTGASGSKYEAEVASMLQRLEQFQSSSPRSQNSTMQWVSGTITKASSMRVILVVSSYEGMYLNSGIGTFYAALSDFLVNQGHSVTVLYTKTDSSDASSTIFNRWQKSLEKKGVSVARLDPLSVHISSPTNTKKAYQIYQYLKTHQQDYDIVHFPDKEGSAYFSVLAKHQGLAFSSKIFVVGLHGPWRWVQHGNQEHQPNAEDMENEWLERRSVELADAVITSTADLPRFFAQQGWDLPAVSSPSAPTRLNVMPFLPGKEIQLINRRNKDNELNEPVTKVEEFVFFGRLEVRKGVILFADALDLLAKTRPGLNNLKITFMGKNADVDKMSASKYLADRAEKGSWPFRLSYITHKDRKGALEYLREENKGRVAVMPSVVDNAPYTVYECLYSHVPFVASDLPSIVDLVQLDDREKVFFKPEPESIVAKLGDLIDNGASAVRSSVSIADALTSWESFYNTIYTLRRELSAAVSKVNQSQPLVSVCLPTYNRPDLLRMAIESITAQDYPMSKIEVVLVDDGSTNAEAIAYIDGLQSYFDERNWQIIRTENKYLGAARNTAARAAKGDFLLFLDDDNLAKPNQISTYISVSKYTSADVITAAHDVFEGLSLPNSENAKVSSMSLPLGPAISVGVFKNCFGDANFFIKRRTFLQLGGFTEEKGVGAEDYEFLAKAVLSRVSLEAIPEPLLYYRMHNKNEQMLFTTNNDQNAVRAVRPYTSIFETQSETDDLLKLLAHRRVGTRALGNTMCNMTVLKITPPSIPANQQYEVKFTATQMDCYIENIYFGQNYVCQPNTLVQNPSEGTFSCIVPPIPYAYNYSVSVVVDLPSGVKSTLLPTNAVLNVYKIPIGATIAVLVIKFSADVKLYTVQKLLSLFDQLLGGYAPDTLVNIISDVISGNANNKRAISADENHNMRFSIQSNDPDVPATGMAQELLTQSIANPSAYANIGVKILSFTLSGYCDDEGSCVCGPTYTGETCEDDATCLNDCSAHGECGDGPFGKICNCEVGWSGQDCSIKMCTNDCSGNGACSVSIDSKAVCSCDVGFEGDYCQTVIPCPDGCSGFGTCVNTTCICNVGYFGANCADTVLDIGTNPEMSSSSDETGVEAGLWISVAFVALCIVVSAALVLYIRRLRARRAMN